MADRMARSIQDEKTPVSEKVVGLVISNAQRFRELNLNNIPTLKSGLREWRIFFRGIAREESLLEAGTNEDFDVFR